MTGAPPVPAGNTAPYPIRQPPQGGEGPKGPVIRTPEHVPEHADAPSGAALAFLGAALLAGTAAIALALSSRYRRD